MCLSLVELYTALVLPFAFCQAEIYTELVQHLSFCWVELD